MFIFLHIFVLNSRYKSLNIHIFNTYSIPFDYPRQLWYLPGWDSLESLADIRTLKSYCGNVMA